jgi:hypothetical protein
MPLKGDDVPSQEPPYGYCIHIQQFRISREYLPGDLEAAGIAKYSPEHKLLFAKTWLSRESRHLAATP